MASVVVATVPLPCPAELVVDASSVGTIEGAAAGSMMTVRVEVEARPFWSVAT